MIDFSEVKVVSIDKLEKEIVKRVSNFSCTTGLRRLLFDMDYMNDCCKKLWIESILEDIECAKEEDMEEKAIILQTILEILKEIGVDTSDSDEYIMIDVSW